MGIRASHLPNQRRKCPPAAAKNHNFGFITFCRFSQPHTPMPNLILLLDGFWWKKWNVRSSHRLNFDRLDSLSYDTPPTKEKKKSVAQNVSRVMKMMIRQTDRLRPLKPSNGTENANINPLQLPHFIPTWQYELYYDNGHSFSLHCPAVQQRILLILTQS